MPDSSLQHALDAYNSNNRAHYPLNGTPVSNLEAVEYYLAIARKQLPQHRGIPITIANMHTFRGEVAKALDGYRQCLSGGGSKTDTIQALCYLVVWHHYTGDIPSSSRYLEQLRLIDTTHGSGIASLLVILSHTLAQPIQYVHSAAKTLSGGDKPPVHAIVALGHVLNSDGSMTPALIERLKLALQMAYQQPESLILVTGGLAKQGKTESQQMKRWLVKHGIEPGRVIEENRAVNTIDNARFSIELMVNHHVTSATLVSASIHVHRAQLLFETLAMVMKLSPIAFNHCAVSDGLTAEPTLCGQIRRNCYIDCLRAYGLPAFNCEPFMQL